MDDFLKTYFQEAQDLIENVLESLETMLDQDRYTDPTLINEIMRRLHTLKGNSNIVGFTKIGTIVHKLEDIFVSARDGKITLSEERVNLLIDIIKDVSGTLEKMFQAGITSDTAIDIGVDIDRLLVDFLSRDSDSELDDYGEIYRKDSHEIIKSKNVGGERREVSADRGNGKISEFRESDGVQKFGVQTQIQVREDDAELNGVQIARKVISEKLGDKVLSKIPDSDIKKIGSYIEVAKPIAYFFVKLPFEGDFDAETRAIMDKLKEKGFDIIVSFADIVDSDIVFHFVVSTSSNNIDIHNLKDVVRDFQVIWLPDSRKYEIKSVGENVSSVSSPSSGSPSLPAQGKGRVFLKIDTFNVDKILNIIGDMVIAKNAIQSSLEKIMEISGRPEVEQKLKDNISEIERKIRELQDIVLDVRMLSLDEMIRKIKRDIERSARNMGKSVVVEKEGESINVDYEIASKIKDAMMHISKNALVHGIETPEERIAAGKHEVGKIIIRTFERGGFIFIEIIDDGRGIDPERVVRKYLNLIKTRNFPEDLILGETEDDFKKANGEWDLEKVFKILFIPGFSTKDSADQNAGRGAGLDEVKQNIESIKGKIVVQSSIGDGTKFTLKIPTSKVVLEVVIFSWKGEKYAIPLASVEKTEMFSPDSELSIKSIQGRRVVLSDGAEISLVTLDEIFGREPSPLPETFFILFIETGEDKFSRVGLVVEEIIDIKDAVMKSFDEEILDIRGVSAVVEEIGEDGQKEIIPVIDVLKSNLI